MKKLLVIAASLLSMNSQAMDKVVYGVDNRFELPNSPYSQLKDSVVSMVSIYQIKKHKETGDFAIKNFSTLETYRGRKTCDDMKFRTQPTVANCSGFLIADDLVVTAGHCVLRRGQVAKDEETFDCSNNAFVFGYDKYSVNGNQVDLGKNDVYRCAKVVEGEYTYLRDYAVIKLDKKVVGKKPVKVNTREDNYKEDESIFVVGNPTGLPTKIAAGSRIRKDATKTTFTADLDTFGGNSGSAIFNTYGEAIGILVSGEQDYFYDQVDKCVRVNVCDKYLGKCTSGNPRPASGETGTKLSIINHILKNLKK